MSFKVAEVYADITKKYIHYSLNHHYRGKNYEFSDDLLTILESDFKQKARNLDWLFQGKTRVSLKPSNNDIFMSIQGDSSVSDFITVAEAVGYKVDTENFVNGYVIINKQQVKLHKVRELILAGKPPILPKELSTRLVNTSISDPSNKYTTKASYISVSNDFNMVGEVLVRTKDLQVFIQPQSAITSTWKRGVNPFDTDYISTLLNSSEVVMSLDLNDYITCSEGSFSSCMSMNSTSSRHLGWMMHFRSDFSVITFTHRAGDSFYKTGRTWTFLKLTENGLPYARPFYKLSRVYGELNNGHVSVVDTFIQKNVTENLGLSNPKKHTDHKSVYYNDFKYIVSPNMQNTNSNYIGTGYFDWPSDNTTLWERLPLWEYKGEFPVTPFTQEVYAKGPMCLYNFPDALDINGNSTNKSLFTNEPANTYNNCFGWNEKYKQFVRCQATGSKILFRDALEISKGVYVAKEHAITLLSGGVTKIETIEPTIEEIPAFIEVELNDEDVVDF